MQVNCSNLRRSNCSANRCLTEFGESTSILWQSHESRNKLKPGLRKFRTPKLGEFEPNFKVCNLWDFLGGKLYVFKIVQSKSPSALSSPPVARIRGPYPNDSLVTRFLEVGQVDEDRWRHCEIHSSNLWVTGHSTFSKAVSSQVRAKLLAFLDLDL